MNLFAKMMWLLCAEPVCREKDLSRKEGAKNEKFWIFKASVTCLLCSNVVFSFTQSSHTEDTNVRMCLLTISVAKKSRSRCTGNPAFRVTNVAD